MEINLMANKLLYPITTPHNMPEPMADGVKITISKIGDIYEAYTDKYSEINSSTDLTNTGKNKKLSELGMEAIICKSVNQIVRIAERSYKGFPHREKRF